MICRECARDYVDRSKVDPVNADLLLAARQLLAHSQTLVVPDRPDRATILERLARRPDVSDEERRVLREIIQELRSCRTS